MDKKVEIRREVRQRIKALDEGYKRAAAHTIFERIEALEHFVSARCIALYAAMSDEVPTEEVLGRWHMSGRRIVVPRVEGEIMRFYDYDPTTMTSGAYGISEPQGEVECNAEDIDLIIVPARAFTRSGIRLGRGGGFYDKYMSLKGFRAHKSGVAFECQIFDSLPYADHDILVDEVITER